nr:extracellular solute-binding protein [Verticiella sediminum]
MIGAAVLCAAVLPAAAQSLTVYTAGPGGLAKALAAGYTARTGVPVDVFQADTGKVLARLEAEAANPHADVVISASWDSAVDLSARGLLQPYTSAHAAQVPAAFRTQDFVAQGLSALAIAWNTRSGTPRPADWQDLAAPAFKDKVNLPDPAQSGTSLELLLGLQAAQGDAAWKLLGALRENGASVAGANAQALNPVLQGAKAAVFGAVDYVALGSQDNGEAIEVIFPASGTVIAPRPMMVMKAAPNPAQAQAFIDYVLSDEGQALVADTFLLPARADVPARRAGLDALKLLPLDAQVGQAEREATLRRFAQVFGRK